MASTGPDPADERRLAARRPRTGQDFRPTLFGDDDISASGSGAHPVELSPLQALEPARRRAWLSGPGRAGTAALALAAAVLGGGGAMLLVPPGGADEPRALPAAPPAPSPSLQPRPVAVAPDAGPPEALAPGAGPAPAPARIEPADAPLGLQPPARAVTTTSPAVAVTHSPGRAADRVSSTPRLQVTQETAKTEPTGQLPREAGRQRARPSDRLADRDVVLIEAMVTHLSSPRSGAGAASAATQAPERAAARAAAASATTAQAARGRTRRAAAPASAAARGVESVAAQVQRCEDIGGLEGWLCRWRVCADHWGVDPACPTASQQQSTREF